MLNRTKRAAWQMMLQEELLSLVPKIQRPTSSKVAMLCRHRSHVDLLAKPLSSPNHSATGDAATKGEMINHTVVVTSPSRSRMAYPAARSSIASSHRDRPSCGLLTSDGGGRRT